MGQPGRPFEIKYFNGNPFTSQGLANRLSTILNRLRLSESVTSGLNEDSLWALSQCRCSPNFAANYFQLLVQGRGTLPQPLTPAVREEVRRNSTLQALLSLPPGLQNIGSTLAGFFVKDEEINTEIQKGLDDKLRNALRSNGAFSTRLKYNFDLYPSPYVNLGDSDAFSPKTLNISAQSSKWAFVYSVENMWNNRGSTAALAFGDHSLQLLVTSIAAAEWSYAFGLDDTASGTIFGGIAFDPRQGVSSQLGAQDPRKNPDATGVISGNYNVSFPESSTLQLVTSVKEQWARNTESIPLDEQARLWTSTAMAFGRFKPTARNGSIASIYAPASGMLPDNVHELPLAFLPGMAFLLDGPFVDKDTREIRAAAAIAGSNRSATESRARLKTLARMGRAMQYWIEQTITVAQERLSADITKQIVDSQASLKDAMRLSVQAILDNHTEDSVRNTRLGGIAMVRSKQDFNRPPMAEVAEALAVISDIDLSTLNNQNNVQTDLNKKIVALYHWFAAEYLTDLATGQFRGELTPSAVIWTYIALKNFARYPRQLTKAPWLIDALRNTETALIGWDRQFNN